MHGQKNIKLYCSFEYSPVQQKVRLRERKLHNKSRKPIYRRKE